MRAVDQFAAKHNAQLDDRPRNLNPEPHPNKLVGQVDYF